jgi:hypothetical protein
LAADPHGDTYADGASYKPEEADARTKAIAEYGAGLALDDKSEPASVAQQRLDHLQAGEVPHGTIFYCQELD